jgi:hypothetical protein
MNSSPIPTDSQGSAPRRDLLVAGGGIRVPTQSMRDPFEALDDLMVVVWGEVPVLRFRYRAQVNYKELFMFTIGAAWRLK